jgi:hypothetical protein
MQPNTRLQHSGQVLLHTPQPNWPPGLQPPAKRTLQYGSAQLHVTPMVCCWSRALLMDLRAQVSEPRPALTYQHRPCQPGIAMGWCNPSLRICAAPAPARSVAHVHTLSKLTTNVLQCSLPQVLLVMPSGCSVSTLASRVLHVDSQPACRCPICLVQPEIQVERSLHSMLSHQHKPSTADVPQHTSSTCHYPLSQADLALGKHSNFSLKT